MPRHGLRVRLLAGTVLVAAGAVAATTWVSVQGTTTSIEQQQSVVRNAYPEVYHGLVDYAATHTSWSSVHLVLSGLAQQSGVRVVLTPVGAPPIESSPIASGSAGLAEPSVAIDPLTVDNALVLTRYPDGINPKVVGPFQLTTQEHADLEALIGEVLACLDGSGVKAPIAEVGSGRPYLRVPEERVPRFCRERLKSSGGYIGFENTQEVRPTPSEAAALTQLAGRTDECAGLDGPLKLTLNARGEVTLPDPEDPRQASCLLDARRQVLRPYVAPAAFLQITSLDEDRPDGVGLSSAGVFRIAGVAALVLVLTVGVAMVLATRVIRPVRALTEASRLMRAGDRTVRARTSGGWEIAELTAAFNEMAEHAERTERQRTELVNDISHELRTPLGTIRGWLVATQDGVADLDPHLVSSLLEETLLLQHLVDDLRDLALDDAGQSRLDTVELDLAALLRHVAAAAAGRVTVDVPAELPVVGDPIRLRQVIGNLMANAERHTPPGGRIAVSARRSGADVVVDVTDTGSGIAAEDLPYVFDRFWRADKSRTRRTGGSGLGLAIVRQLVEAHGGTVSVTSTLGEGSTFTLRLPGAKEPS